MKRIWFENMALKQSEKVQFETYADKGHNGVFPNGIL